MLIVDKNLSDLVRIEGDPIVYLKQMTNVYNIPTLLIFVWHLKQRSEMCKLDFAEDSKNRIVSEPGR
jgi:hypothetical protein